MSISLVQFAGSSVAPVDDAALYARNSNGILRGCSITYTAPNTINISAGYVLVAGRVCKITATTLNATLSSSGTVIGRLYIKIDTSVTTAPVSLLTSVSKSSYTQEDINGSGSVYEFELAAYTASTTAITALYARISVDNDWRSLNCIFTYASNDSSVATNGTMYTVTINTSSDISSLLILGDRFMLDNVGATKYGILVAKTTSSITLLLPIGTSITSGIISNVYYSHAKCPVGFSVNPNDWLLEVTMVDSDVASPAANTWINVGSRGITLLIGSWDVGYEATMNGYTSSATDIQFFMALSSSSSSVSDIELQTASRLNPIQFMTLIAKCFKPVTVTSKTPYYLIEKSSVSCSYIDTNQYNTGYLRVVCAYL